MSARRLPVYRSLPTPEAPIGLLRKPLGGRSIGVADTQDGELALRFSEQLVGELARRGLRVPVCFLSFESGSAESGSALSPALRARFAMADALGALSVAQAELAPTATFAAAAAGLWIGVGQPALLAFETTLSVLLGADAAVLRWPEALRLARASFTLALSGDGVAVAKALAEELARG